MAISTEEKKQIINNNIRKLEQEQYNLEIKASVLKKVGDDRYEEVTKQIEKAIKIQDAYREKLDELSEE